ncbi:MAG: hypothetical protein IPH96_02005 [Saprospiraceae bacterium]|nr:hypothetical protein [Saprospiraceae bacterium]
MEDWRGGAVWSSDRIILAMIPTYFGQINHGPDGRLYVNGEGFPKRHIHTIHRPNEQGLACDFRQHDFPLYSNLGNFPHFPHYWGWGGGWVGVCLGISNICHSRILLVR